MSWRDGYQRTNGQQLIEYSVHWDNLLAVPKRKNMERKTYVWRSNVMVTQTFPNDSKLYLGTIMFRNNEITSLKLSYILVPSCTCHYFSSLSSLSHCLIWSQKANVSSTCSLHISSNPCFLLMMTYYA